jgi:hypothetical protein
MIIRRLGEEYSSGDVVVTIAGLVDVDPSAIEYDYKYAHTARYGIKRKPRGWNMGKVEYTGKITLPLDVVAEFEKVSGGDIAKIRPFPINVTFANEENDMIHDYIYCKFEGNGRNVKGDDGLEKELDLFVLDMKLNQ